VYSESIKIGHDRYYEEKKVGQKPEKIYSPRKGSDSPGGFGFITEEREDNRA